MKEKKLEKGQILYIVALAFVVLLGFTAFAIDGANVYSVRRQNQSTADSAALGGAEAASQILKTAANAASLSCSNTVMGPARAAAESTALADNITLVDNDLSSGTGVTTTCGTSNGVPYLDIHAMVSTQVNTYFLKVISRTPIKTATEAIARVYINSSFAGGNALVTTGTTCDANGGIYAIGNGQIYLSGGGAYARSCLLASNSAVILSDNLITYSGQGNKQFMVGSQKEYSGNNGLLFNYPVGTAPGNSQAYILKMPGLASPSYGWQLWQDYGPNATIPADRWPLPAAPQVTALTMDPMVTQACTGPNRTFNPDANLALNPGTYTNGINPDYRAITLAPGVYCIPSGQNVNFSTNNVTATGGVVIYFMGTGNFTASSYGTTGVSLDKSSIYLTNGNFLISNGKFTANNMTIYIKQGDFTINNGANGVVINAPGCNTSACGVGPAIPGLLLYMDGNYSHNLLIDNGGGTPHKLNGTMFCPTTLAVFKGGTNTSTLNVQLIAQRVEVNNSAVLSMDIDNATLYSQGSTTIQLMK
jgi:hypothetical protein